MEIFEKIALYLYFLLHRFFFMFNMAFNRKVSALTTISNKYMIKYQT